jgi:hypothetical protein
MNRAFSAAFFYESVPGALPQAIAMNAAPLAPNTYDVYGGMGFAEVKSREGRKNVAFVLPDSANVIAVPQR